MAAIAVVGSLNMDLVIRAPRQPRLGETLLGGSFGMTGGGKGANQAVACARLRAESHMIGCVGDDHFGARLRTTLTESRIGCDCLETRSEAGTGVAVVTVADGGASTIVLSQGANALLDEAVLERAKELFKKVDAVLFQLESPPEAVAFGLKMARRTGCRTFLSADPLFPLPPEAWHMIDCLVLNQTALDFYSPGQSSGDAVPERKIADLAQQLIARGVKTVVVTRSARGGMVFSRGKSFDFLPFKVQALDSTGARDAFCAALSVGISEGMPIERAVRFAAAAGALACTRFGAQPSMPWRHEVEAMLETDGDRGERAPESGTR
ncbi:ribokinase [Fretibacterium sp. OH1220_COT-178]|uniref:ribokinase n=1 Tax=Fretibacterium sp. OH1220_COT-178 TaxID=2491047 RepID=UPI000F5DD4B1|nr:ribokinase [Fretibacterium sp. OH1220_COT-178]RRD65470.1 ribokinase [Fretibacterium sp. OH1220_COT-178]